MFHLFIFHVFISQRHEHHCRRPHRERVSGTQVGSLRRLTHLQRVQVGRQTGRKTPILSNLDPRPLSLYRLRTLYLIASFSLHFG